eukprot:g5732.t1
MGAPRATKAQRAYRMATITKRLSMVLEILSALDSIDDLDAKKRRGTLVALERRPFADYIRPMLQDHTFSLRFRMDYVDFIVLDLLRPALKRNDEMGLLRNGSVPAEHQVAMTLRWLAGGSIYECMDGHVIARSTAYSITSRVIRAMNSCPELNCKWPEGEDVTRAAGLFRNRSSFGVIRKCIGAIDGLFIRLIKPTARETAEPNSYFSGHKKGFGMNFQAVCDAEYRIIAWTMNCPGSQNDRTAFKFSGFDKLLTELPIASSSQDAFNFYQSQCRMAIEQTFGIMVRRWGILWRPIEVGLKKFEHVVNAVEHVVNAVVRMHNFCRNRKIQVPTQNVGSVVQPSHVIFDDDGLISSDYFETVPVRSGRPAKDQAKASKPRKVIRMQLDVAGFARPEHNVARNFSR